ncbi:MAG TPA: DUF6191 domain-containing protein [Nakamurella sp.]
MGELGALFNPGMRHELEERRAKAARREEEGNARDGDLRIDLDSGVAVINTPTDDDSESDPDSADAPTVEPDEAGNSAVRSDADPAAEAPAVAENDGPAEAAVPSRPAPLRPRGKRAMAAGKR